MTEELQPAEEEIGVFLLPLVLLPFDELALHATNRRHSEMIADLRRNNSEEFGIIYVDRNSESGIAKRALVGTVAHLEMASPYTHGRWSLIVRGERRFRVLRWERDDPYPVAMIESLPDAALPQPNSLSDDAEAAVRRVRRLLADLGDASTATTDLTPADDPVAWSWQLCAAAPLNANDQQQLLEIDDPKQRLRLLISLMDALYGDFAPLGQGPS